MARRRKSFAFRFHEILRYSHDDKVFGLRPKRKPIRSVLINGLCLFEVSVRKANAEISAELMSHTSPFCNDYNKLQSVAFLVFVFLFPTRQKLRFHLSFSHPSSLVFDVREPLCVQYENAWHCVAQAATQAKWHNKGTILIYASADFPSSSDVWLKRESTMFEK